MLSLSFFFISVFYLETFFILVYYLFCVFPPVTHPIVFISAQCGTRRHWDVNLVALGGDLFSFFNLIISVLVTMDPWLYLVLSCLPLPVCFSFHYVGVFCVPCLFNKSIVLISFFFLFCPAFFYILGKIISEVHLFVALPSLFGLVVFSHQHWNSFLSSLCMGQDLCNHKDSHWQHSCPLVGLPMNPFSVWLKVNVLISLKWNLAETHDCVSGDPQI